MSAQNSAGNTSDDSQNQSNQTSVNQSVSAEESIFLIDSDNSVSAQETSGKSSSTVRLFVRMILVLVIVIALIYFVLWFIKRKTNVVKTDDDYLRRAAYINIAPGKTVEVITLIDRAYLIGVTEDNITMLGEIDDKELISAMNLSADKKSNSSKPVNFSQVLDMFLVKGNKKSNIFKDSENAIYSAPEHSESENNSEES